MAELRWRKFLGNKSSVIDVNKPLLTQNSTTIFCEIMLKVKSSDEPGRKETVKTGELYEGEKEIGGSLGERF